MTPGHIFQSFWHGNALSPYEKMCMASFIDHGHAFHLYAYAPQLDVPDGVELRDAAELLPESEYFAYKKGASAGSHAAFANLFRYRLLAERGGWWVDTDVVCLTADIPRFEEFFARQSDDLVNNAVLFFKPADPVMVDCFNEADRIRDAASWGEIGPLLLTRKLKEQGRDGAALPKSVCYPLEYGEALEVLRPGKAKPLGKRIRGSLFLHLWNEIFRRNNVLKLLLPPRGSLLREIAERHNVEGWRGEYRPDFIEHTVLAG